MEDSKKQEAIRKLEHKMSGGSNPRTPESIRKFRREAEKFLARVEGESPTPEDAENWVAHTKRTRKSVNYQNIAYWAVKRLYIVNKWDFPDSLEVGPRTPEFYQQQTPVFGVPEISKLVLWAKENANPQEAAMIAISTTWGLRREEMRRIEPEDVQNGIFVVRTGKHGRARAHIIPPEIEPYIRGYDFEPRLSLTYLSNLFMIVCYKGEVPRKDGTSWHGVRRTIAGFLEDKGWAESKIANYLRWSTSRRGMAMRYAMATREDKEVDQDAYLQLHWLRLWY